MSAAASTEVSLRIGVPKEIKNHEYRVGLIPSSVRELVAHGHEVIVETHAGYGIGLDDEHYTAAGARIVTYRDTGGNLFADMRRQFESGERNFAAQSPPNFAAP